MCDDIQEYVPPRRPYAGPLLPIVQHRRDVLILNAAPREGKPYCIRLLEVVDARGVSLMRSKAE